MAWPSLRVACVDGEHQGAKCISQGGPVLSLTSVLENTAASSSSWWIPGCRSRLSLVHISCRQRSHYSLWNVPSFDLFLKRSQHARWAELAVSARPDCRLYALSTWPFVHLGICSVVPAEEIGHSNHIVVRTTSDVRV